MQNINSIYKHNVEAKSQKRIPFALLHTHFRNSLNKFMLSEIRIVVMSGTKQRLQEAKTMNYLKLW